MSVILNYENDLVVSGIQFNDVKFEFERPETSGNPDSFQVLVGENSGYLDMNIADAFTLSGDLTLSGTQSIRVNADEFIEENFGYLVGYTLYDKTFYWKYNLYENGILNNSSDMRVAHTEHSDGYLMAEVYQLDSDRLTALQTAVDMPRYNKISNKIKRKIQKLQHGEFKNEVQLIKAVKQGG